MDKAKVAPIIKVTLLSFLNWRAKRVFAAASM
jgi:hypothetical protein